MPIHALPAVASGFDVSDIGLPGLAMHGQLLLFLGAVVVLAFLTRRIKVVGTIVSVVCWAMLAFVLVSVLDGAGRFNPYIAEAARALRLDDQEVSGQEVRIRMASDGHFWVRATINGTERRMLVDSGATITALSADTAQQAGLELKQDLVPVVLHTANGAVPASSARIDELRIGNILARDLRVVVSPAFGDMDVIGMNFLSMLASWRVEGRTLVLVPHHPQDIATIDGR